MKRLLGLLIRLYPPGFRRNYGQDMARGIESALAIGARGRLGRIGAGGLAAADLIRGAAQAWWDAGRSRLGRSSERGGVKGMGTMEQIRSAVAFAWRRIRKAPGFSGVVVLILALGIGANAAVFSLVDGVLLRPLPYDRPEDLVFIWSDLTSEGVPRAWVNGNHAHELAAAATTFSEIVPLDLGTATLSQAVGDRATGVVLGFVAPNFFPALGVAPRLGRGLLPEEQGAGTPHVAVLTDGIWRTAFGSDPDVVGSTIRLDEETYEVVGVMGPAFSFRIHQSLGDPTPPGVFVPIDVDIADMDVNEWGFSMAVMGRIAPGVPHDRALAELDQIASRLGERDWGQPAFRFAVGYLGGDLVAKARPLILLLMAGVAVVLAIVCANVATVFLARGVARQRDAAVQVALGAGRGRLAAGTAAETLLLALAGAALGLPLAHLFVRGLVAAVPSDLPRIDEVALDLRIGLITLVAATAVGLVTAVAPSLLHRGATADALRSAGSRTGRRTGAARGQKGLVAAQVALSTALLISVALIGRSMVRLLAVDGGFRAGEQITFTVQPGNEDSTDAEILGFYGALTERLESIPGVRHVGRVTGLPLSTRASQHHLDFKAAPGATGDEDHDEPLIDRMAADEGYLEAAGLDLVEGRWFRDEDLLSGARVAVMDQILAERFWPGGSPVGLRVGTPFDTVGFQVVGVVRQPRLYDLGADDRPQWWVPHSWATYRRMSVVVDGASGSQDLADEVQAAVRAVDPAVAVSDLGTMADLVENSLARWRFAVQIMGVFGVAALLLAVLGVYGVIAYTVERRTGELGIRMALGARSEAIQRMVLGQGVQLVAWGLLIGTVGGWASGRLLGSLLYEVTPRDPLSTVLALGLLLGAAVVATVLPARKASRIPPTEAFRAE